MIGRVVNRLLDPVTIFFVLGGAIGFLRLVALGFKSGSELAKGGLPAEGAPALAVSLFTAVLLSTFVRKKQRQLAVVGGAAGPGEDEDALTMNGSPGVLLRRVPLSR